MKRFLPLIVAHVMLSFFYASAQKSDNYQLSFRYHYGFIMPHAPSMQQFANAHFPVYELTFTKLTHGEKNWQRAYHNPDLGMSFYTTDFGKNAVLGRGYALFPHISFHYLRKKWLKANFRFGAGLGYIEKPFDRLSNYKNNAIGSHLNSAISVMIETKFRLSAHSNLGIGLAMNHFSNGASKTPNLGVNLATANIAYAYTFGSRVVNAIDSSESFQKHFEYFAIVCGGFKELAPPGGNKYTIITASLNVARVHSVRGRWGIGLDVLNDASIAEQFKRQDDPTSRLAVTQTGMTIGWEVLVGKVSFPLQAGFYLLSKYKSNGVFYNRYGIRYQFHKHLFANVSLKTHFAKADYFEWGLGYKL